MRRLAVALMSSAVLLVGHAAASTTTPAASTITSAEFSSSTLGRTWRYTVYLPTDYETAALEYPVMYLLHGSGGDESDWDAGLSVLDELIAGDVIPPAIAIAPASGTSWWVDSAEPFETAFFADLIPHVDATYRTIADRGGRAVAGFSMGGYGALRYALAHSDTFAAATLLSASLYDHEPPPDSSARRSGAFGTPFDPALWEERNYPATLQAHRASARRVPTFIGAGDDDWNEPAGWEYNVEYQAVLLFERLNKLGSTPAELRIVDGGHNWALWRPLLVEALPFMFEYLTYPTVRE